MKRARNQIVLLLMNYITMQEFLRGEGQPPYYQRPARSPLEWADLENLNAPLPDYPRVKDKATFIRQFASLTGLAEFDSGDMSGGELDQQSSIWGSVYGRQATNSRSCVV